MNIFLEIVRMPSVIVAIVTLIGLIAIGSKATKVISGTTVAFVGFTMIKLGAHILGDVLSLFSDLFKKAFNLQGIVPSNEAVMSKLLPSLGTTASIILVIGLIVNILVARFTRFKAVYLSLHLALFSAFAMAAVFYAAGTPTWAAIVFGGIWLGLYMAMSPALISRYTKDVVNSEDYTIAHSGSSAYFIGAFLASKFGNKDRDAEDITVNDKILFLKDPNVATFLTMFVLFFVSSLIAGPAEVQKVADHNFVLLSMDQAARFAGGLFIVKAGIKLFVDELVPAFKGFARIFAPSAIPGVDVLVLFDRSPNTALLGFLTSFGTGVVMMFLLPFFGLAVVIPGLMACFITGGAAAILGNAQGGLRGAVIASVVDGLMLSVLPAVCMGMYAGTFTEFKVEGSMFADPDMLIMATFIWLAVAFLPSLFGKGGAAKAAASIAK
ncbi:PTS ascorbate transporter subunit IIC [Dermabacteraceae bacterium P13115]|nr:hypothetical protein [Dermabacteraceae bacterium TAE3-ERU5]